MDSFEIQVKKEIKEEFPIQNGIKSLSAYCALCQGNLLRGIFNWSHAAHGQSHYREVPRWEIFMEQELRFGSDLGQMADLPAFKYFPLVWPEPF